MDPNTALSNATRLAFDVSLHFRLTADTDITPANNDIVLNEKDRSTVGICIHKNPGELAFTLNASVLQIKQLTSDFDIRMEGTAIGNDQIHWKPKMPSAGFIDVTTTAGNGRINNLVGDCQTRQTLLTPPRSGACGDESLVHTVTMETVGADNHLAIHAAADPIDIDLAVTNLKIVGRAGDPTAFAVKIKQHPHSNCVFDAVEGTVASFFALLSGVPAGATVQINWTTSGGTPLPPVNGTNFRVQVPSPPAPITVTVEVVIGLLDASGTLVEGPPIGDSYAVDVIKREEADRRQWLCEIMMETRHNSFVDPLWDPLRDMVRRPMTRAQVMELQKFSQQLDGLTKKLLTAAHP